MPALVPMYAAWFSNMIDAVTDEIWMIEPPFGMFATNRWKNWKAR